MAKTKSAKNVKSNIFEKADGQLSISSKLVIAIFMASLFAVAFILIKSSLSSAGEGAVSTPTNRTTEEKRHDFLKWIVDNGGVFYPIQYGDRVATVTLEKFPEFGWGLALTVDEDIQCLPETTEDAEGQQCQQPTVATESRVKQLDPLFTIPSSLIITIPKIMEIYSTPDSSQYIPTFHSRLHFILRQGLKGHGLAQQVNGMGMVEQDVVMALFLMVENCQHENFRLFGYDSFYGPYLNVLPPGLIPRLDTFGDEEYKVLNDQVLEGMGRESKRVLLEMYNGVSGTGEVTLKTLLQDMIMTKLGDDSSKLETAKCTSFESFHRFVALMSSRAMVLRGEKRIVPLAEMINYAPLPISSHRIQPSFELFHTLGKDGSMTVRSDRNVALSSGGALQLFEDYGPVDSSLFLEAHGFIPDENPHHCVVIPGSLIEKTIAPDGIHGVDIQLIRRALQLLRLAPTQSDVSYPLLQDYCVRKDLSLVEDGNDIIRRPASDSIALTYLLGKTNEESTVSASTVDQCMKAVKSNDAMRIEIQCSRYQGSKVSVRNILKRAATTILNKDGYTVESDLQLNELISSLKDAQAEGRDRMALALKFRIQERRLLTSILYSKEQLDNVEEPEAVANLEGKLRDFNAFVESLQLPVNKLQAKIVGSDMRVGAFAAENIEEGDVYVSLPPGATMDYETALKDVPLNLRQLLQKYEGGDGFMTLLIYLIHERFVLKEGSKWWPYLNLLPTIRDVKASHPLFYKDEDINQYLAGSHARQLLLGYHQKTHEKHRMLSSDLDAILVLGSKHLLDRDSFLWASAIIDSRSIWWNGKRHLTPLLDLVNADSEGLPHETRSDAFGVVVTKASRNVDAGAQVFENYAQPNYLLFIYHGFILEDNPHDCALISIALDRGLNNHLIRSTPTTFCIRDIMSLEQMAHILRMKYNLPLKSKVLDDDIRPYLIKELVQRISRLKNAVRSEDDEPDQSVPYHIHCMQSIVRNDLRQFEDVLKLVVGD